MKGLSVKWQKIIVWLTGYLNVIAFFLAGAYVFTKTEDEDVKKSAKTVLLLTLGFTALEIFYSIISNIMEIGDASFDKLSGFAKFFIFVKIIKAIAFVTFGVLDFFKIKVIPVEFLDDKTQTEETNNEIEG